MTSPTDDRDLEEYLAGGSEISRRYRELSQEQPTRTLDRAVLIEARTAGEIPAKATPFRQRRARWMVPFAAVATVLLSFAIFRDAGMNSHAPAYEPVPVQVEQETVMPITTLEAPAPEFAIIAPASPQAPVSARADKQADKEAAAPPAPVSMAAPAPPPAVAAPEKDLAAAAETNERLRGSADMSHLQLPPKPAAAPVTEERVMLRLHAEQRQQRIAAPRTAAEETLAGIRRQLDEGNKDQARQAFKEFLRLNPGYFGQHAEAGKTFPEFADLLK